ncbi:MAG: hypothetical protein ACOCQW_05640 [Halanaerobiaceae bacterium]
MKINKNHIFSILVGLVFLVIFSGVGSAVEIIINEDYVENNLIEGLEKVELNGEKRIHMDLGGADIYFDNSLSDIYISEKLRVRRSAGKLTIYNPDSGMFKWFDDNYKVVVGTAEKFDLININAGGINVSGIVFAEELNINAGGIDIDGEFHCDDISIDGAGMDIDGFIKSRYIAINGAGIDMDLDVAEIEDFKIKGVGISADIKYMDTWSGIRHISITGVGGDLNVRVPDYNGKEENGQLDIDTGGIISTDIDYY